MPEAAVAIDGGAPAPAENLTPVEVEQVRTPEPLSSQTPVAEKPDVKDVPKTASDAIKRAQEQVKAKEAAREPAKPVEKPKAEAKPEPEAKTRDETGKFVSREPKEQAAQPTTGTEPAQGQKPSEGRQPYHERPARFLQKFDADWQSTPDAIKAEVHRNIQNLEQGFQKHKASAERYEQFRQYDEQARQNGRDFATDSIPKVIQFETMMRQNPMAALDFALREAGPRKQDGSPLTLMDVAAHVMNQSPDQRASQQNSTIASLQSEIADLKRQLGGVSQTIQQQQQRSSLQQVQDFVNDNHPRFDELSEDIAFFLETRRASTLQEAYELAERLNPAPVQPPPQAQQINPAATPTPQPINPAGGKSISGAPSSGSTPGAKKKGPNPSIRDALKLASAQAR